MLSLSFALFACFARRIFIEDFIFFVRILIAMIRFIFRKSQI